MTVRRKSLYKENPKRWSHDPNKQIHYELQFNKKMITPGTRFKLKRDRKIYTFHCLVYDIIRDKTWIECMCNDGQFHSVLPNKIARIVVKRSYDKKCQQN